MGLVVHLDQLALQIDHGGDVGLGGLEAGGKRLLVDLGGALFVELPGTLGAAGFHHHDGDVAGLTIGTVQLTPGHDHVEGTGVALGVGGVGQPLTIGRVGQAHRADRTLEGDAGQHERCGGAVERQHVVGVLLVGAEDEADDVDLVAEGARERRAQRPVDQTVGEDGGLGGPPLTTEEGAGDLSGGVRALFDVDGEREEVGALADPAGSGRGDQHPGVTQADEHGAVGEGRQATGLHRDLFVTGGIVGDRGADAQCALNWRCDHVVLLDEVRGDSVASMRTGWSGEASSQLSTPEHPCCQDGRTAQLFAGRWRATEVGCVFGGRQLAAELNRVRERPIVVDRRPRRLHRVRSTAMNQRGGPPTGSPTRRAQPRLAAIVAAIAIVPMVACGSSGDLSQSDFEAVITDSRIGTEVGAVVARNYAACLYRATGGEVSEIVDHVDDEAYQPNGTDADALAACSDVLIDAAG